MTAPARAAVAPPEARPRVLLVDDEPAICSGVGRCLARLGYEVTAVGSGPAALAALESGTFDALLVDHRMPGMSGDLLIREALARHPELAGHVVLASGDLESESIRSLAVGAACRTLRKPFELAELGTALRGAVQGVRSER